MGITILQNIVFEDSYILGWVYHEKKFLLFLQILLTKNHPCFEPYDEKTEFGCFKLAVLDFSNVIYIEGLAANNMIPKWDAKLKEFIDFTEINGVKEIGEEYIFETDDKNVVVKSKSFKINILKDLSERAFEEFIEGER